MNDDKVNFFTDIFEDKTTFKLRWYHRISVSTRKRKLLAMLILTFVVVFTYFFEIERACVEVFCQDPYGITYPDRIVVKGTIDDPVGWKCTDKDEDDWPPSCSGYAPVGGDFDPVKHEVDADAEWRKCLCWNKDWRIVLDKNE
jgi:hypothetical protein